MWLFRLPGPRLQRPEEPQFQGKLDQQPPLVQFLCLGQPGPQRCGLARVLLQGDLRQRTVGK